MPSSRDHLSALQLVLLVPEELLERVHRGMHVSAAPEARYGTRSEKNRGQEMHPIVLGSHHLVRRIEQELGQIEV